MDRDILLEVYDTEMLEYRRLLRDTYRVPVVYVITNTTNDMKYVGSFNNFEDMITYYQNRTGKRRMAIQKAMDKDGFENFECQIYLQPGKNSAEVAEEVNRIILELDTLKPNGYNNAIRRPYNGRNKKQHIHKKQTNEPD